MTDYTVYLLSGRERRAYYFTAAALSVVASLLFYRSVLFACAGIPAALSLEKTWASKRGQQRRDVLLDGFRDALYSISTSLSSGRQLPDAVLLAGLQAKEAFGATSDIARELLNIAALYDESHSDIEELLQSFGERSGLEEVRQFADICAICRKTGADLERVALLGAEMILERIHFRREVQTLTAQKRLDTALLVALPVLVLLFLNLSTPAYLSILYKGVAGRFIMTACLATIVGALMLSLHMIEVTM